jgi:hypothetical protein
LFIIRILGAENEKMLGTYSACEINHRSMFYAQKAAQQVHVNMGLWKHYF